MSDKLKDYFEQLKKLEYLYAKAFELSTNTSGRENVTKKEELSILFFVKVVLTVRAILKLLPNSKFYYDKENLEIWDISSIATLVRSLIECYFVLYYFCVDNICDVEFEFRYKVWNYHSEKERFTMLTDFGSKSPKMNELFNQVELMKSAIENDKYFKNLNVNNLDDKLKREWKRGICLQDAEIAKRIGISMNYIKAVYRYLSNYAHTLSFSISQLRQFETYDEESLNLFEVLIEYCIAFLSFAIRDYVKVFPNQNSNIDEDSWRIIKNWENFLLHNARF